ncbi:Lrp/AsnC family transcriptional regulator [Synergistes jonesii]|uniref:Lrp/AsnC family transcriptional regulator n=1 Tax=Synergistes jonesii TaxID=2754 RepID=UPI002430D241|nr:Lrp/AsnC family transcriptional regulator [Synergistes jonesii]
MGRNRGDNLDDTGWRILEELQKNSRLTFKEIGNRVGLSCSSVAERVRRMEEEGLICGYTAIVDGEKAGFAVQAIVEVKAFSPKDEEALGKKLLDIPSVLQCWNITGDNNFVMETAFESVKDLQSFLVSLGEHGQTFSSIVLDIPHRKHLQEPRRRM